MRSVGVKSMRFNYDLLFVQTIHPAHPQRARSWNFFSVLLLFLRPSAGLNPFASLYLEHLLL